MGQPNDQHPTPSIRIIHEDELDELVDDDEHLGEEDQSMTFGEAITLLIALGVLIYLIYALLWPERF